MADITMCFGKNCDKKEKCYRYTAPINEYRQSVFKPNQDFGNPCKYFWNNEGRIDGRKIDRWWKHEI